mgnify:CR=1 FL=1
MKSVKYHLVKEKSYVRYSTINVDISFDMKKKKDKESLGTIKFYDEKIINKVVNKSIDNRFNKLLEYVVECEEDDDPDGLLLALNETEKFKRELINKYEKFLDKKKIEFNQKKIELIKEKLKKKLMIYRIKQSSMYVNQNPFNNCVRYNEEDYEEEKEEEHHRSR